MSVTLCFSLISGEEMTRKRVENSAFVLTAAHNHGVGEVGDGCVPWCGIIQYLSAPLRLTASSLR